ncbi:MAG: CGGC domain-containing protein, partial [Calditrichaeota bacterium]|nr:CGGC domain-containing protein [Calditrichota bacterium]
TTCDGCPGGNVEYAPAEMKKNGAEVIHFATGLLVGYPPCPYLFHFRDFIKSKYRLEVVMGTHPIPTSYLETHTELKTWDSPEWQKILGLVMTDKKTRDAYN